MLNIIKDFENISNISSVCDFCDRSVLQKQGIIRTKLFTLIQPRNPINFGNIIIVPNRHVEIFTNITDEEAVEFKNFVSVIFNKFNKKYSAVGYNLFTNCGEKAGQDILHNHWHIFIRFQNEKYSPFDVLNGKVKKETLSPEKWEENKIQIQNLFN